MPILQNPPGLIFCDRIAIQVGSKFSSHERKDAAPVIPGTVVAEKSEVFGDVTDLFLFEPKIRIIDIPRPPARDFLELKLPLAMRFLVTQERHRNVTGLRRVDHITPGE